MTLQKEHPKRGTGKEGLRMTILESFPQKCIAKPKKPKQKCEAKIVYQLQVVQLLTLQVERSLFRDTIDSTASK